MKAALMQLRPFYSTIYRVDLWKKKTKGFVKTKKKQPFLSCFRFRQFLSVVLLWCHFVVVAWGVPTCVGDSRGCCILATERKEIWYQAPVNRKKNSLFIWIKAQYGITLTYSDLQIIHINKHEVWDAFKVLNLVIFLCWQTDFRLTSDWFIFTPLSLKKKKRLKSWWSLN